MGSANFLRNFGDGANVGFECSRGAIRAQLHFAANDFAGESFDTFANVRACTGQTEIHGFDSQRFNQMKDFDFFGDGRIEDGRILQAVAQRFIIESYFVAWIEI